MGPRPPPLRPRARPASLVAVRRGRKAWRPVPLPLPPSLQLHHGPCPCTLSVRPRMGVSPARASPLRPPSVPNAAHANAGERWRAWPSAPA